MGLVLSTDFTGTNGAAWPTPWASVVGTNTIQNNRGRQVTPAVAFDQAVCRPSPNLALGNGRIDALYNAPVIANSSASSRFRFNYGNGSGYRAQLTIKDSMIHLYRSDPTYAETQIGSAAFTWSAATDYRLAIEFNGSTVRVKTWEASGSEPGSWNVSVTDATYATGGIELTTLSGATASAVTIDWDNVNVDDYDIEWTYGYEVRIG
jgi:hypothetical protein